MTTAERKNLIEQLKAHQCKLEECGQCRRDTLLADELERLGNRVRESLSRVPDFLDDGDDPLARLNDLANEFVNARKRIEFLEAGPEAAIDDAASRRETARIIAKWLPKIEAGTADIIDANRLAELESCEADAKRWRQCVSRGLFPTQSFGRWHVWGQAEYRTPEAAIDAATKGGAE